MQQNEVPLFEFAAPFDQPLAPAPAPAVNQLQAPAAPGLGANHSGTGRNAGGSGSSAQGAGQGQSTSKKPSDRSLFISSLHPDAEFTHLHEVFDKFGKIISCRVLKDAKTGQSRCIGYVNFQEPADAQRAIEATHGKPGPVGGGPICVRYAEDDPAFVPEETKKLFIRYVPLELTVDDVRSAFAPYGTVTDCTIMPDTSTAGRGENELWNMAYVTYSTSEEATNACAKSHKSFLLGPRHELIVKPAETLATRAMRQRKHDGSQSNSTVASASNRTAGSQHVSSLNQNPSIMPIMTVPYPGAQMAMVHPGMAMQPPAVVAPPGFRVMYMPAPNGIMQPVMVPDTGFMPMMQPMMVPMMMAQPQGFVPMMVPQPAAFGAPPTSATE